MIKRNLALRIDTDMKSKNDCKRWSVIVIRDLDMISGVEASSTNEAVKIAREIMKERYKKDSTEYPFNKFTTWDFEKMRVEDATDSGKFEITIKDSIQTSVTIEHHLVTDGSAKELFERKAEELKDLVELEVIPEKGVIQGYSSNTKNLYLKYCIR